jgi:hypothetical protein
MQPERIPVEPAPIPGNAGIVRRYPLDEAVWIWKGGMETGPSRFVEFLLRWTMDADSRVEFDLTADQRFRVEIDGRETGRGPDRSEFGGWSFHRYGADLAAGDHEIRVLCWWLSEGDRPVAQVSDRPAFALKGLGDLEAVLSTGEGDWRVRERGDIRPGKKTGKLSYHVIGCSFELDGAVEPGSWEEPVPVLKTAPNSTGIVGAPWRLEPSPLAEQRRERFTGGRVRWTGEGVATTCGGDGNGREWQGLTRGGEVEIPANTSRTWFWDFETYVCGYPELDVCGGAGARVEMQWAESLYETPEPDASDHKGHRGECAGKHWLGFGDTVLHPGGDRRYRVPWWRSGRWLRLVVTTGAEALILRDLRPLTTGYPFERAWRFAADEDLVPMLEVCEAGLRNCAHETFVDCPYYEQMQYLGDTRTQALTWMVASADPRPLIRALDLFDRSRWVNGFHAERCPTGELQMSATYSLVYPPLLRDAAWWLDEPEAVRRLLPGMRSALEAALACVDGEGLPSGLPGWLFVDWVDRPLWKHGLPPGQEESLTAPVALHLPVALDAAAQVEDAYGEPAMAARWRERSRESMQAILRAFYDHDRGCFRDDREGRTYSEHSQALALATDSLPDELRPGLVAKLADPPGDWAKATVYFSYHVHEALLLAGHTTEVFDRFAFWRALPDQGFHTTVEKPEPSRSDCHGWGAHPLFHCLSAFAGIRPDAPGFARVKITPRFGPLTSIQAAVPHPKGEVSVRLERKGGSLSGRIATPVPGTLLWQGEAVELTAGEHTVQLGESAP